MKVSSTSWHYRLWRLGREDSTSQPKNLCLYFWHIFLFKVLLPCIVLGFALLGIGALILNIVRHPVHWLVGFSITLASLALLIGLVFLIRRLRLQRREERAEAWVLYWKGQGPNPEAKSHKNPSPFWEYLRARKQKVCPMIEVEHKNRKTV